MLGGLLVLTLLPALVGLGSAALGIRFGILRILLRRGSWRRAVGLLPLRWRERLGATLLSLGWFGVGRRLPWWLIRLRIVLVILALLVLRRAGAGSTTGLALAVSAAIAGATIAAVI